MKGMHLLCLFGQCIYPAASSTSAEAFSLRIMNPFDIGYRKPLEIVKQIKRWPDTRPSIHILILNNAENFSLPLTFGFSVL